MWWFLTLVLILLAVVSAAVGMFDIAMYLIMGVALIGGMAMAAAE